LTRGVPPYLIGATTCLLQLAAWGTSDEWAGDATQPSRGGGMRQYSRSHLFLLISLMRQVKMLLGKKC